MKRQTTIADIFLIVLLGAILPFSPLIHPKQPRQIGKKIIVNIHQRPTDDSLHNSIRLIDAELEEMNYYFRVHNVTDEGYNQIAAYHTQLQQRCRQQQALLATERRRYITYDTLQPHERTLVAVKTNGGYWKAGHFHIGQKLQGRGIVADEKGRVVRALWDSDTILVARRTDSLGVYEGQMNMLLQASGQGTYRSKSGSFYDGHWLNDKRQGFGYESSAHHQLRVGEWKKGRFMGERLKYTSERIYGIDISRHQHEKGRKRYAINWRHLRILSLGKNHPTDGQTFPISFIYIKATQSTTIVNRYFRQFPETRHRCQWRFPTCARRRTVGITNSQYRGRQGTDAPHPHLDADSGASDRKETNTLRQPELYLQPHERCCRHQTKIQCMDCPLRCL